MLRPRYVKVVASLLKDRPFRYLLFAYDYDQTKYPGPPHSVPEKEVRSLYGEKLAFGRISKQTYLLCPDFRCIWATRVD